MSEKKTQDTKPGPTAVPAAETKPKKFSLSIKELPLKQAPMEAVVKRET